MPIYSYFKNLKNFKPNKIYIYILIKGLECLFSSMKKLFEKKKKKKLCINVLISI